MDPREDRLLQVMGEVNAKYGGDPNEFKSVSDIIDDVVTGDPDGGKKDKAADSGDPVDGAEEAKSKEAEPKDEKPKQKKKYKVEESEYELDDEQADRFTQKGIYYEKKQAELIKKERSLQELEAKAQSWQEEKATLLNELEKNPARILSHLLGPEKAFEALKPFAAQMVRQEMEDEENPQNKQLRQLQAERDAATARLQAIEKQREEQEVSSRAQHFKTEFEKQITGVLEMADIPKIDAVAREVAGHMQRAISRGITYTPDQLAQIVREDNQARVHAMNQADVTAIQQARKANDSAALVKAGARLADRLGEDVVLALSQYHLSKLKTNKLPPPIVERPRVDGEKPRKPYMSEDEYKEMRRKIVHGEIDPPAWW